MIWILAALLLGIVLNQSTTGGTSWPIGSVVAVVIMGIYIKTSQDKHFEELKDLLEKKCLQEDADPPAKKARPSEEQKKLHD